MRYLRFAIAGLLLASPLLAGSASLSQSDPSQNSYSTGGFSVCASGTRSFKVSYSYGYDPAYGIGPNPYRMTVRLFRNGSQIASTTYQWASAWTNQFFPNVGVTPGTYTATVQLEERTFHGLSIGWTTLETVSAMNSVVVSPIPATPAFSVDGVPVTANGSPIDVCASMIRVDAAATTCESNYWLGVHEMDRWNWTHQYEWGRWFAGQAPNGISLQQLATSSAGYWLGGPPSRQGETLFGGYLDPPNNTVERYYWVELCTAEPAWQCKVAVIKVNGAC
jgi:hypothetical protein